MSNKVKHVHLHFMHHDHYMSSLRCTYAWALIHLHHTGSQEELLVAVQEEQTGTDPQEVQAQEVPEEEEQGEDLPECVDHQPSSFERGKPRSILSLLLYKSNSFYMSLYIVALSCRSWLKPLMHLLLSLPTLLPFTLLGQDRITA